MALVEVDDTNNHLVRARLYPLKPKSYKWKHDVGDRVRIAMRVSRSKRDISVGGPRRLLRSTRACLLFVSHRD